MHWLHQWGFFSFCVLLFAMCSTTTVGTNSKKITTDRVIWAWPIRDKTEMSGGQSAPMRPSPNSGFSWRSPALTHIKVKQLGAAIHAAGTASLPLFPPLYAVTTTPTWGQHRCSLLSWDSDSRPPTGSCDLKGKQQFWFRLVAFWPNNASAETPGANKITRHLHPRQGRSHRELRSWLGPVGMGNPPEGWVALL